MPPQVILIFLLSIALPVSWLLSEFQGRRWLRILLGVLSLSMSILIAMAVGTLQQLNDNAWYGEASAKLLDTMIAGIDEGRSDQLLSALRQLQGEFYPTYQNRANFDKLVDQFARQFPRKKVLGQSNEKEADKIRRDVQKSSSP